MNTDQIFQKLKSTLHIDADDLLIIGKLSKAIPSNPNCGFASAFFKIEEGIVKPILSTELMIGENDFSIPTVFIRSGYEQLEKDYGETIFIFRAQLIPDANRSCKYCLGYSDNSNKNHVKITKEMGFIAEISKEYIDISDVEESPFQHRIENIDSLHLDTPFLFQLSHDKTKLLGPLYKNSNADDLFHGPVNSIAYPFWNGKKRDEFKAFVIDIESYQGAIASIGSGYESREFLINLENISYNDNGKIRNEAFKSIDLAPYNIVLNEFYKLADKSNAIKAYPKTRIKEWLDNKTIKLTDERKRLIESLLLDYSQDLENKEDIYKAILSADEATPLLKKIAEENEDKYLINHRDKNNKELEKIKVEFEQQRQEIVQQNSTIKEELAKSKKELQQKYDERDALLKEIDNKIKVELENVQSSEKYKSLLAEKNNELNDLNDKISKAVDKYGHYDELGKLDNSRAEISNELESLKVVEKHYQDTINKIKEDINAKVPELATRYLNQQIIQDIQNFDFYKYNDNTPSESEFYKKINPALTIEQYKTDDLQKKRAFFINEITDKFKRMNRVVEKVFVESAIVAIMQNQFVVFIGLPGTGKTSFAKQLALALGAGNSSLLVPVSKEWTRPKDLIGYYNSLTKKFESGTTKFKPFYDELNQLEENLQPPSFLILDEFNLSQPEYYLSNLTGLADLGANRDIEVGANKFIPIPKSNRFICTANTDDTVQGLTPRMISRCVFIRFNEIPDLNETMEELQFDDTFKASISGSDLIDLFNVNETDVLSEMLQEGINQIIHTLRSQESNFGLPVSITPRKYNQLIRFCKVMDTQEYGSDRVLDIACLYYLLPIISGSGAQFKNRLIELKSVAEDLSLDNFVAEIKTLISTGENNFDYFQFVMG